MPPLVHARRYAAPASAPTAVRAFAVGLLLAGLAAAGCTAGTGSDAGAAGDSSAAPSAAASALGTDAPDRAPGAGTAYCRAVGGGLADLFATIQGPGGVDRAMSRLRTVIREAPPAVAGEWRRVGTAAEDVEAGLTDLARLQGRADAGEITPRQLRRRSEAVLAGLDAFDTPRNARAADRVMRHAARHCGVGTAP